MRSEYQANRDMQSQAVKAKQVMTMPNKSFAFRLAALAACDNNKGKVW